MNWREIKQGEEITYILEDNWGYCKNCSLYIPNLSKKGYCQMCEKINQDTLKEFL